MLKKPILLILVLCVVLSLTSISLAQPAGQEMGGQERARQLEEQEEALRKKIEGEKKPPQG